VRPQVPGNQEMIVLSAPYWEHTHDSEWGAEKRWRGEKIGGAVSRIQSLSMKEFVGPTRYDEAYAQIAEWSEIVAKEDEYNDIATDLHNKHNWPNVHRHAYAYLASVCIIDYAERDGVVSLIDIPGSGMNADAADLAQTLILNMPNVLTLSCLEAGVLVDARITNNTEKTRNWQYGAISPKLALGVLLLPHISVDQTAANVVVFQEGVFHLYRPKMCAGQRPKISKEPDHNGRGTLLFVHRGSEE